MTSEFGVPIRPNNSEKQPLPAMVVLMAGMNNVANNEASGLLRCLEEKKVLLFYVA